MPIGWWGPKVSFICLCGLLMWHGPLYRHHGCSNRVKYVCTYHNFDYEDNHVHTCTNTGTVIEGPSNVTYLPGLTPLPIELTCNVTGFPLWRVNGTTYTLTDLTSGALPGHSRTGTNILVNSPMNNTEYVCISQTNNGDDNSDPAYIIIAGEQSHVNAYMCLYIIYSFIIFHVGGSKGLTVL